MTGRDLYNTYWVFLTLLLSVSLPRYQCIFFFKTADGSVKLTDIGTWDTSKNIYIGYFDLVLLTLISGPFDAPPSTFAC